MIGGNCACTFAHQVDTVAGKRLKRDGKPWYGLQIGTGGRQSSCGGRRVIPACLEHPLFDVRQHTVQVRRLQLLYLHHVPAENTPNSRPNVVCGTLVIINIMMTKSKSHLMTTKRCIHNDSAIATAATTLLHTQISIARRLADTAARTASS